MGDPNKIEPAAGFDWQRVKWGAGETECAYCDGPIPTGAVPLTLFDYPPEAAAVIGAIPVEIRQAAFCNTCAAVWFGVETFAPPDADRRMRGGKPGDDE